MALVKDISGTAFVVAEFRAEENKEETPLYNDWVVELFLSANSRYAAGLVAASFPPAKDLVRIRTKYFDETLRHLSDHAETVNGLFPNRLEGVPQTDAAAWVELSRVLLNLDEFITRD